MWRLGIIAMHKRYGVLMGDKRCDECAYRWMKLGGMATLADTCAKAWEWASETQSAEADKWCNAYKACGIFEKRIIHEL